MIHVIVVIHVKTHVKTIFFESIFFKSILSPGTVKSNRHLKDSNKKTAGNSPRCTRLQRLSEILGEKFKYVQVLLPTTCQETPRAVASS